MITVACVYWKGKFRGREKIYNPSYVQKLKNMVERNLSIPHKFVCLSNTEVPTERIPLTDNLPGYWSKLELFKPGQFDNGDKVLYLDLDTIILQNIDRLVEYSEKLTAVPNINQMRLKEGKQLYSFCNSSVMTFYPGEYDYLYNEFYSGVLDHIWGDQDYISFKHAEKFNKNINCFPKPWVKKLKDMNFEFDKNVLIALCMMGKGKPGKNKKAAKLYKWIDKLWI